MEGSSSQSGSSSTNTAPGNLENNNSLSYKTILYENMSNNRILLKLEEDGFITPDEKAKELIKELSEIKYLYALKVLFENLQNEFSSQSLINSLEALIDPTSFNYYSKESMARLELHLRTWVLVLERICFLPIVLSKELRDKVYNSLAKFAEIHRKTTQVIEIGLDNNFRRNFNQFNQQSNNQDEQIIKKRNYNIDFLLIHLRDTLHSLRDDETCENNLEDSLEKFRNLLTFVKEKYHEDLKILSNNIGKGKEGKGKSLNLNSYLKKEQTSNSNILNVIADEITCPISSEPTDQLCILKCQHMLALSNLKRLKQKICPNCREKIEDNDIRYLPQNSIYKNLYTKFFESGHILPSIELKNSDQLYDSDDSDNSEVELILTKKKKFMNSIIKLNSNISSSLLSRITKKQHPTYQNIIKEINEKHYEKAESLCKEFLNFFPKSYSLRCILAYIYRCLNNYEQAHLYLEEAINLNPKKQVAYFICGEIYFRQNKYDEAIDNLKKSLEYKAKLTNLYTILGNSCLLRNYYTAAAENYNISLKNDSNNYLCLKNCAYSYERQEDYLNALKILDKLLNINEKDSLVLCYYGEILYNMKQYSKAILYFTKANIIDPENIHNLNKRAIAYYIIQEYDKVLLDLDKIIQLDPLNSSAYYLKSLTYYTKNDINNAKISFKKYAALLNSDNFLAKIQLYYLGYLLNENISKDLSNVLTNINQILNNDSNNELLLLIRCKIHIELNKYYEAIVDLDMLFEGEYKKYYYKAFSYIHLLRKHSDFWSYLCKVREIDKCDFTKLGIINEFSKYMYKEKEVYFISNLTNLDSKLCQFQESDISRNIIKVSIY
ncbi:TPR-like protein [Rhizophagus irregularis]|uniref:TPR-like protein n=1 Tax=Rhizophagus irregularis TaxID=588596 RepID=A0A2N0RUQ5_9GLOM|nr:TPR-like protein [Rhizophagus irregularis]